MTLVRTLLLLAIAMVPPRAATNGSWMNDAYTFRRWCERPVKSLSFGLSNGARDLLLRDIERKLKQLKLDRAKTQVEVDGKTVSVTVTYRYPSPERHIVRQEYVDDIPKITARFDYGWQITIEAENGKLLTSDAEPISEYKTY